MNGLGALYARAKVVTGVVLPLLVLSVALVRVDPVLLAGAALALGTVFGVTYAYASYVEFEEPTDAERER